MNFIQYLEDIEKATGSKQKLKIIETELRPPNTNFEEFLRITFNDTVLNISDKIIESSLGMTSPLKYKDIGAKVEQWLSTNNTHSSLLDFTNNCKSKETVTFEDFKKLLADLEIVRGNKAKDLLHNFLTKCTPQQAKWCCRCIKKNLACSLQCTSINKVLKILDKELISVFKLSLCSSIECANDEHMKKELDIIVNENKKLFVEPKHDGIRLVVKNCKLSHRQKTHAISRNGNTIESVPFLLSEFDRIFDRKLELDGELVSKDFQTLMTQVHRKRDFNHDLQHNYNVFDIITCDGNDVTYLSYKDRRKLLEKIFLDCKDSDMINLVNNREYNNVDGIVEIYHKSVDAGYEGIVIKNDAMYTRDRENWWKMKPVKTADMRVHSFERATTGRHVGKVNVLILTDKSKTVISRVGSGISNDIVKELTELVDVENNLDGQIVEVKYDSVTKSTQNGVRSLRFPRFVVIRYDKNEEDSL